MKIEVRRLDRGVAIQVAVAVLLLGTLGMQLAEWESRRAFGTSGDGVEAGEPFGVTLVALGTQELVAVPRCAVIFVVDPDCATCRSLAARSGEEAAQKAVVWMSVGNALRTEWYAEEFGLENVVVVKRPRGASSNDVMRQIGVPVVPTRLTVDASGNVLDMLITQDLPSEGATGEEC